MIEVKRQWFNIKHKKKRKNSVPRLKKIKLQIEFMLPQ